MTHDRNDTSMIHRAFLTGCIVGVLAVGIVGTIGCQTANEQTKRVETGVSSSATGQAMQQYARREDNGVYKGERLSRVAFPMGGIGAGMICLEGTGTLSHVSLHHRPDVFNEPCIFAAISVKGKSNIARVLEGPVPSWKLFGQRGAGNGLRNRPYGLPRFAEASFRAWFPFGVVNLSDPIVPLDVELTGWSPFEPNDADNASLPVAALEYRFINNSKQTVEAVFSFNAKRTWNFMDSGKGGGGCRLVPGGFILIDDGPKNRPWQKGAFSAIVTDPRAKVNCAWFRSPRWSDPLRMAWRDIENAACNDRPAIEEGKPSPGGTLFVPFKLAPGKSKTIVLQLAWFVGESNMRQGKVADAADPSKVRKPQDVPPYEPWYAGRFKDIDEVAAYWREQYDELRRNTKRFSDCFYDTTLPDEVIEAVAANLTILKSPTVLRQADGRLWAFEGCCHDRGCCYGSCTHVWNYAQAIPHLFPALERTFRETEFFVSQDETGHQTFRTPLPILPPTHTFHAAADGQLGGIMKVYREWRISGDTGWLRKLWPRVKASLDYCIETWDPKHKGILEEPHHNTYDIEFWGPDGMCTSFYLGALTSAIAMGEALGDEIPLYSELRAQGTRYMEEQLYNGEYFYQKVIWKDLRAEDPSAMPARAKTTGYSPELMGRYSPEALEVLRKEGPRYQYGNGCLSDGVLGSWIAAMCGLGQVLDEEKITSHLMSVHKYNFKIDLSAHVNVERPTFACGSEGGLVVCSWPRGCTLSFPFYFCGEVFTGIEYQVASHLMLMGKIEEGLQIVRACRSRYDGRIRNPFDEYECGHWYARALASYGLLQGHSGVRHDAVERKLYVEPTIKGDFRSFLSTATGYGTVGVKNSKPFVEVKAGAMEIDQIQYEPKR